MLFSKDVCASVVSSNEMEASLSQTISNGSPSASGTSKFRIAPHSTSASSDWHLQFNIPEASFFSACVQDAISTGIVTSKARREIIQILRTFILAYTIYPTSEQYTTVCRNLITKFPKLKDDEEGKSLYVSF